MSTPSEYEERLLPSWWAWLLAMMLVLMLSVAYGAALGSTIGWLLGLGTAVLVVVLLWVTAPQVRVRDGRLEVDDATLPVASIGSVEAVTRADIARLRGPGGDARLFVALRPWSGPDGVHVVLDDPDDPHPAWLFTSRHPARVAAALAATMSVATSTPPQEDA